jgi:HEAT repeat protein
MLTVLLVAVFSLQDPKADEAKIKELIFKLSSEDPKERDQASADLLAIGEAALPILEASRGNVDAEAKARIDNIVNHVTLPQRWLKDLLKEEDPSTAYNKMEEALRNRSLDKKGGARVICAVLLSNEADPQLKQYMMSVAERYRMKDIWPAIVEMMTKDENPDENAVYMLQRIRPPREAASAILKILPKLKNRSYIFQLLETVRQMKPDRAELAAAVESLLVSDMDYDTKYNIFSYISQGRLPCTLKALLKCWQNDDERRSYSSYMREAILKTPPDGSLPEMLELLQSSTQEDVFLAADYVSRQRVASAVEPIMKALDRWPDDAALRQRLTQCLRLVNMEEKAREWLKAGTSRISVISTIVELQLRKLAPDVAACLEDQDPAVRIRICRALASLGYKEGASALEGRLKDDNVDVRRAALKSLAALQGKSATRTILQHLQSDSADMQACAVEVLPQMDLDVVLEELTKPETMNKPMMRYALAVLLVSGDESIMHRVVARLGAKATSDDLTALIRFIQAVRTGR